MSYTIAICGKGGTGKTTLAALIIEWLLENRKGKAVLAVDADPNANLDEALGVKAESSIVAIADEISKNPEQIPKGMTKDRFLEYQIQDSLVEAQGFDLLVMGRPEGPGCYCYVNNLLRSLIERLSKSYAYIVIDNEAGMEHLSRRTAREMNLLLMISDYSLVGLRSAKRILDLTKELKLRVHNRRLVINRAPQDIRQLRAEVEKLGIPLGGVVPLDQEITRLSLDTQGLKAIAGDSPAVQAVNKIMEVIQNDCGTAKRKMA